jgi:hypothetical protein
MWNAILVIQAFDKIPRPGLVPGFFFGKNGLFSARIAARR